MKDFNNTIMIFACIAFAAGSFILAIKYQSGYLVPEEKRKTRPHRFIEIIRVCTSIGILLVGLISFMIGGDISGRSFFTGIICGFIMLTLLFDRK